MATTTFSFCIEGIDAYPVTIESDVTTGMPCLNIIGLGDQAIQESGERIRSAILHCGFKFPQARITISLAPGDMKKRGSHYDLAMALALLQQDKQIDAKDLWKYGIIGELSLNAYLRPCKGILPMVIEAKRMGKTELIVPAENLAEAKLLSGINVYAFNTMEEVIEFLEGKSKYDEPAIADVPAGAIPNAMDFSEIRGQNELVEAVVLGVAGGHNILMIGEPGCGKTMVAERIPTIMPTLTEQEALEVTKIHSVKGLVSSSNALISSRPFRAPHHNASLNALIGGGNPAQPGEVSLAHNGVLFLDELAEFPRSVLESLRQPLENRKVTVSRVSGTCTFPANFMLVAAMNPCPCGYYPSRRCRCSDYEIKHYRNRISGPILQRIDIQKHVKAIGYFNLSSENSSPDSPTLRAIVEYARAIQKARFADYPDIFCNAQMTSSMISKFCTIDEETESYLKDVTQKYNFSARVITKLLKLARTSADLRHANNIELCDMKFVLSCRDLDKAQSKEFYTVTSDDEF